MMIMMIAMMMISIGQIDEDDKEVIWMRVSMLLLGSIVDRLKTCMYGVGYL